MGSMVGNDHLDAVAGANVIAGHLTGLKVDLFQTDITVDRNTTLAALVAGIATYVGYAQGVAVWSAVTISDDGEIEFQGTMAEFRPTNAVTPNTIYGWYATDAVGGALLFAGRFDNPPLAMGQAMDNIVLTLRWRPKTGGVINVIS